MSRPDSRFVPPEPERSAGLQTGSNVRDAHEPNWSSAFRFMEMAGVREKSQERPTGLPVTELRPAPFDFGVRVYPLQPHLLAASLPPLY